MKRREFIQFSAAGIALAAVARAEAEERMASKQPNAGLYRKDSRNVDVLVVGGGTAGVVAALQSARAGASTILVESGSMLGGTMTVGGVAFPGLFHAWGRQVVAGIGWELVTETVEMNDAKLPDFSIPTGRAHPRHQVRINPHMYALLAEDKCRKAGVELRYYETPVKAEFSGGRWSVEAVGKGTRITIRCKQIVDCTGNGYMTALAGYPVLREDVIQPGTLMFKIGGYDYRKVDRKLLRRKYEEAIKSGRLVRKEFRNRIEGLLGGGGNNIHHISDADSTTSEAHTTANVDSRTTLLETIRFLREEVPGCEKLKLESMQPETGIRETYRIEGEYQITKSDYITGKVFDDSICYAFYPIDVHDEHGVKPEHLNEGVFPTVPLRALVPKGSQNLIVAGRCVSSDREANSALRVQASCMAMGQAAGAAAALAIQKQTTPGAVPLGELKALLKRHDAILVGEPRKVAGAKVPQKTIVAQTGSDLLFDASAAVAVGTWPKGKSTHATIGSSYLHDDNEAKGEKSITFAVTVTEPGDYAIRFHYNTHQTRSSCTPVTVKIGDQVQSFSVDQRKSDGKGFVLDTFAIQDAATVTISNAGTDGHVIVDGLELIKK